MKPSTCVYSNFYLGCALISRRGQLLNVFQDDIAQVLTMCKGNVRNPVQTFWQDCKTIKNFSTGMVDLTPTMFDVTDRADGFVHYRTWPRESEGGCKMLPGSSTPLQPLFDSITVDFNLNDVYNYTSITDNVYRFDKLKAIQTKDITAQFIPSLVGDSSNFAVVEVTDDDNSAELTIPIAFTSNKG